jgi:hypothetical protein
LSKEHRMNVFGKESVCQWYKSTAQVFHNSVRKFKLLFHENRTNFCPLCNLLKQMALKDISEESFNMYADQRCLKYLKYNIWQNIQDLFCSSYRYLYEENQKTILWKTKSLVLCAAIIFFEKKIIPGQQRENLVDCGWAVFFTGNVHVSL